LFAGAVIESRNFGRELDVLCAEKGVGCASITAPKQTTLMFTTLAAWEKIGEVFDFMNFLWSNSSPLAEGLSNV
jgi:hypothetical protein